jgi:hypothetical protein
LHAWCDQRFGKLPAQSDPAPRLYDAPWIVMSNTGVLRDFDWAPAMLRVEIFEEIAALAESRPDWLEISGL